MTRQKGLLYSLFLAVIPYIVGISIASALNYWYCGNVNLGFCNRCRHLEPGCERPKPEDK